MHVRRLFALALLALTLAGCSVQLLTDGQPRDACEDALGSGRLVTDSRSGLALADRTGGVIRVLWPFGYTARRGTAGIELVDPAGKVVAHEGEWVEMGGGLGADGLFGACSGSIKVVPPPG